MLHELSGDVLEAIAPAVENLGGVFHYSWTLVGIPAVGLLAVILARWFFALPSQDRFRFGIAAVVYLSGAIGVEMVNSAIDEATIGRSFQYALLTAFEESLEFAGVLIFQVSLLRRLERLGAEATVTFG
jgi:hypothetical protein